MTKDFDYSQLSPGIVGAVKALHSRHLITTDSGDGSLKREGMECAWDVPMVAVQSARHSFWAECKAVAKVFDGTSDISIEATHWVREDEYMILCTGEGLRNFGDGG